MDVILVRQNNGKQEKFDAISNEQDFEEYRKKIFRFL